MKIAIGSDHAGFGLKEILIPFLKQLDHEVKDIGPFNSDSVDYPDYVHPVVNELISKNFSFGILICGSANGVAITANKYKEIRAALCWRPDIAEIVRKHNDANVLCIPARFISVEDAKSIVENFIQTKFEGGRHQKRIDKMNCI